MLRRLARALLSRSVVAHDAVLPRGLSLAAGDDALGAPALSVLRTTAEPRSATPSRAGRPGDAAPPAQRPRAFRIARSTRRYEPRDILHERVLTALLATALTRDCVFALVEKHADRMNAIHASTALATLARLQPAEGCWSADPLVLGLVALAGGNLHELDERGLANTLWSTAKARHTPRPSPARGEAAAEAPGCRSGAYVRFHPRSSKT